MATTPLPVDILVGQNIRICRLQAGMSQTELGKRVGVTFQQIQKYERGANRVGANRLSQIADALGVPIIALFEGADAGGGGGGPSRHAATGRELLAKPHALRLLQGFDGIKDERVRAAVLKVIETLPKKPMGRETK
jgi:transcriptional regulator with XRE-family HTH domain